MAHGAIDFDDPTGAHVLETYRIVPPDVVQSQTDAARAHPRDRRHGNSIESGDGGRFMTNSTMGSGSGIGTIIACNSLASPPAGPADPAMQKAAIEAPARPGEDGPGGFRGREMGGRRQARRGGRGRCHPSPPREVAGDGGRTSGTDRSVRPLSRCVTRSPSSTSAATKPAVVPVGKALLAGC